MTAIAINLLPATLVVVLAVFGWRSSAPAWIDRLTPVLTSRWMPVTVGVVTALVVAWVWGSLNQVDVFHDEAAYLLQARSYAAFHWAMPGPALPEFFEQYHVLVTPNLFVKYWPGHALALVPGVWLGLPGLVPIVSVGVAASFAFALTRRVTNAYVALIGWAMWITAPGILRFLATFLSVTTSCALWFAGWWFLLQWRETGKRSWLLLLSLCVGWGGITRPFTWLLFAIPVGFVVLPALVQRRAWVDIAWASGIVAAFVSVLVTWCLRTTGSPFLTPYALYTKTYLPDDVLGFGLANRLPLRPLNEDMVAFTAWVRDLHARHSVGGLAGILAARVSAIVAAWDWPRSALLPFIALSGITGRAELRFAVASSVLLLVGHLAYAHEAAWTAYYLEIQPVVGALAALGIWRLFVDVRARRDRAGAQRASEAQRHTPALAFVLAIALLGSGASAVASAQRGSRITTSYRSAFRNAVASLPGERIIVFVRYGPRHNPHNSLVVNDPELAAARAWIVHDRGADNERLLRLAPDRIAYLFDEQTRAISPIGTPAHVAAP